MKEQPFCTYTNDVSHPTALSDMLAAPFVIPDYLPLKYKPDLAALNDSGFLPLLTRSCLSPHMLFSLASFSPWGTWTPSSLKFLVIFPLYSYCPPENSLTFKWCCPNLYFSIRPIRSSTVCIYNIYWTFNFNVLLPHHLKSIMVKYQRFHLHPPLRKQTISTLCVLPIPSPSPLLTHMAGQLLWRRPFFIAHHQQLQLAVLSFAFLSFIS